MQLFQQYLLGLIFYITFSLFAALGLAFALRLIKHTGIAYAASKLIGLSVFGYFIWLLGSLKILNYQNIWLITALFVISLAAGLWTVRGQIKHLPWGKILLIELISLALYFIYLYIRSFNPQAYGTEKFMDMALLAANGKSNFFPAADPWYAGQTVNYYYYGHYLMSLLANLSRIPYALAYNFALALLFCQTLVISFATAWSITKKKFFAALAAFLIIFAGSMFYAGCELNAFFAGTPACSYASSTRLYTPSYIINEIPSYSFTVGDLHAHMMALPFFILVVLLLWVFWKEEKPGKLFLFLIVVQLVTSALINTTDAITLNILLVLAGLYKLYRWYKPSLPEGLSKNKEKHLLANQPNIKNRPIPWHLVKYFAVLFILELVLYFPFLHSFKNPTLGVGIAPIYASAHNLYNGYQYPTPFLALLGMWGVMLAVSAWILWKKRSARENEFPLLLTTVSLFLIIGVELIFIKDIYSIANPPYFRANTVFKFGYHTWTMLCLAFSASLAFLYPFLKGGKKYLLNAFLIVFIFLSGIYPYEAIKQFFLTQPVQARTLDGSDFLKQQSIDDYNTVGYMNQNIKTRSVLAEAVGDSYTYYARMSVFSGQISLMGWKTHEWTWRLDGSTLPAQEKIRPNGPFETGYGVIAGTAQDAQTLYETTDFSIAKSLIAKYGIEYIYVGNLERTTYAKLDEKKFYQLADVVFTSGNSHLFKVR